MTEMNRNLHAKKRANRTENIHIQKKLGTQIGICCGCGRRTYVPIEYPAKTNFAPPGPMHSDCERERLRGLLDEAYNLGFLEGLYNFDEADEDEILNEEEWEFLRKMEMTTDPLYAIVLKLGVAQQETREQLKNLMENKE